MRVYVVGGFLGAGKTTLALALARRLQEQGERVAVITNDQGRSLVDTARWRGEGARARVHEIAGGCFCCRFDELERALLDAADGGATVAIAEAVGSCTDLVATVLAPLADRHPARFELAALAVVVDPWRVIEMDGDAQPPNIAYLFRKQIEEADVVLISRADLDPPDVSGRVRAIRRNACVLGVSGTTGEGLGAWLAAVPAGLAPTLDIDYNRYARAEALLGWCDARVRLVAPEGFAPGETMRSFLEGLVDAPVAHVKVVSVDPLGGSGALVRRGQAPVLDIAGLPERVADARWIVNARVALPPTELEPCVRAALEAAAAPARVEWEEVACFQPSRPVPRHRYARRDTGAEEASCCAAFYDRADVRALLGDSWHPGGVPLTLEAAGELGLEAGGRILDVACGSATSLRAILAAWPVQAFGVDVAAPTYRDQRLDLRPGDAHALPFDDGEFDALLCECALSTFLDQAGALAEMRRVLRPGGRIAVSDMIIEGDLPHGLADWVHTGTCLARALSVAGYRRALSDAGFQLTAHRAVPEALRELLRRIKRNLVGAALAAASSNLGANARIDVREARTVLRAAEDALAAGIVSYGVFVAERAA